MKSTLNKCQGAIGKETTKFLQRAISTMRPRRCRPSASARRCCSTTVTRTAARRDANVERVGGPAPRGLTNASEADVRWDPYLRIEFLSELCGVTRRC